MLKYIRLKNDTFIVFGQWTLHNEVISDPDRVHSAGYCTNGPNGWKCFGMSESLKKFSDKEDSELLQRQFGKE